MIEKRPFGRTGNQSTRILFGAAALGGMSQARADATLDLVLEHGINHIDTAASYGDSELRLAPFLARERKNVFLATKTGDRDYTGARRSIEQSLERMGVDHVDMIQLHNLTHEADWQRAMGEDGALRACIEARDAGLVRHIGVTGHGTYAARMHLRSLERFDFDAVLLPYNHSMMSNPDYAEDFEALHAECSRRDVAVQTIKSIARRRWRDDDTSKRFAWYEPLREPEAITRAIHYVLRRPGLFLNTTSDATLLPRVFEAATRAPSVDVDWRAEIAADHQRLGIEPLFVRDVSDDVFLKQ